MARGPGAAGYAKMRVRGDRNIGARRPDREEQKSKQEQSRQGDYASRPYARLFGLHVTPPSYRAPL